jgi:pimeloyl-ACP methyl ester carboxylesterase
MLSLSKHEGRIGQDSMRSVVYLLPGLLCDAAIWQAQTARLSLDFDVRVPNFFGYDSIPSMARGVLADAPEQFAVAGHSMGGRVALEIMRLAPERVERLALLNTGIHEVREGEAEKRQVLVDLAFAKGMKALAAAWAPPMVAPRRVNDAALMGEITAMVCRATPDIFHGQISALLNRPTVRELLGTIRCPVQVIGARQDGWSPVAQHEEIASLIPGTALTCIEDCGHMSPMEQPAAVAAALTRWLA